jgi:hypothetical protein
MLKRSTEIAKTLKVKKMPGKFIVRGSISKKFFKLSGCHSGTNCRASFQLVT